MATGTVAGLLAAIDALRPELEGAGGGAGDEPGRLPDAAVSAVRRAGLLRIGWPALFGGLEATTAEGIALVEALASVDPAVAWVCAVGSYHGGFVGAYAGEEAARAVLGGPEDPIVAGQVAPVGRARPTEGGLVVSGRWSFASGIHHAAWVLAGVVVEGGHGAGGQRAPTTLDVVVPIDAVTVLPGTWDVAGLEATGSCDYRMDDVFVPDAYTFPFPTPARRRGGSVFEVPVRAQVMVLHAGFPLGVGRAALDEVVRSVRHKRRPLSEGAVADRPSFRRDLGMWHVRLRAVRLAAFDVAARLGEAAAARADVPELVAEARAVSRSATDVALGATTWAFRAGGGAALHRRSRLQRLLRDLLAAAQHAYVDEVAYEQLGEALLGAADPPGAS